MKSELFDIALQQEILTLAANAAPDIIGKTALIDHPITTADEKTVMFNVIYLIDKGYITGGTTDLHGRSELKLYSIRATAKLHDHAQANIINKANQAAESEKFAKLHSEIATTIKGVSGIPDKNDEEAYFESVLAHVRNGLKKHD